VPEIGSCSTVNPYASGTRSSSAVDALPVDWLPKNHLGFFLLDLEKEFYLQEINFAYLQKDPRGEKAFHLRKMVVLLLYASSFGILRLRKIEDVCFEDAPFRVHTCN